MSTHSTPDPRRPAPAQPDPAQPDPDATDPAGPRPAAGPAPERDRVTALFARALEDGGPAELDDAATRDAVNEAFRELLDLAYSGESRAERATRAILDVEVARADTDGTMPTPAEFDIILERSWTAHLARRDQDTAPRRGLVFRPDGSLGFEDDDPDPL